MRGSPAALARSTTSSYTEPGRVALHGAGRSRGNRADLRARKRSFQVSFSSVIVRPVERGGSAADGLVDGIAGGSPDSRRRWGLSMRSRNWRA